MSKKALHYEGAFVTMPLLGNGGDDLKGEMKEEAAKFPSPLKYEEIAGGTKHPNLAIGCKATHKEVVYSCLKTASELGKVEAIFYEKGKEPNKAGGL